MGQGRWVRGPLFYEVNPFYANKGLQQAYLSKQPDAWYNPMKYVRGARDYMAPKIGLRTDADVKAAEVKSGVSGYQQGLKQGPEALSTGQATELAGRKIAKSTGKALGRAADYTSDVMSKGAKAFRRGMEDNPAGIGAAAVGAGLGALGLSKLLRRRRQAPA